MNSRQKLESAFKSMESLPENAPALLKRKRGRDLEKFMKMLLESERLEPKIRLRPTGEELDGSFVLDNRVFLFELKWHGPPIPAPVIYIFQGKVDGKLVGTVGFFISISGYSEKSVDALTKGKALNVLLFDGEDLKQTLPVENGFSLACRIKLRAAVEDGLIFFPFKAVDLHIPKTEKSIVRESVLSLQTTPIAADLPDVIVLSEGITDRLILTEVIAHAISETFSAKRIRLVDAGGKMNLIPTTNRMSYEYPDAKYFVVADADLSYDKTKKELSEGILVSSLSIFLPSPTIESWLFPDSTDPISALSKEMKSSHGDKVFVVRKLAMKINIKQLMSLDSEFQNFWQMLVNVLRGA